MTWPVDFDRQRISLHVPGRISEQDAARQMKTAEAILARLASQPGVILADEVGMGKTFVAMAVAASVAWADKGRNPVVVMVPSSLKAKWPRDFDVFQSRCLRTTDRGNRAITSAVAEDGVAFLKLLDDPLDRRKQIIFLTHGALSLGLNDPWTKLAILRAALHSKRLRDQRRTFPRFAAEILRFKSKYSGQEQLFEDLLSHRTSRWREILKTYGENLDDDPVPESIANVLEEGLVDLHLLRDALVESPVRDSVYRDDRVRNIRQSLVRPLRDVWREALIESRFFSPLLILDEAHHLKNPATTLASLFVDSDALEDENVLQGALKGRFERMLFLTATPFQLGHNELLNVLDRFRGIRWKDGSPRMTLEDFITQHQKLHDTLDMAQHSSLALDERWGSLRKEDVSTGSDWWSIAYDNPSIASERIQSVIRLFETCRSKMREAETLLQPWVIRHRRNRYFEGSQDLRRRVRPGCEIQENGSEDAGILIGDDAMLPFLLVARSQAVAMAASAGELAAGVKRLTFVDGLASSYEAYWSTRVASDEGRALDSIVDEDEASTIVENSHAENLLKRYQEELKRALPRKRARAHARHPKIAATVDQVRHLWRLGEKVLVFCHFRATGRALEKHISAAIEDEIATKASHALRCKKSEAGAKLTALGDAFNPGRPAREQLDREVVEILDSVVLFKTHERERIADIILRFVRTESFLVRYFPLDERDAVERLRIALEQKDQSGLSLRAKLQQFVRFLEEHHEEREEYLDALIEMQTGRTVRRATGETKPDQRRRLLLSFNTPFVPDVLVASSVLAEGVDLHLACRYVIHHDLSWNPSTLEQRTGRVDRIGAKAEQVRKPINVFLPYLGGTQDEKMYRVVRDRERWFQVLMGEEYKLDEIRKDQIAERVPLPESAARTLSFKLDVMGERA
jgi:superfamily II DNA or RNA helicase